MRPLAAGWSALRGLTVRGRAFLLAGVTCALVGLSLGEPDLGRIGCFVLALPLAAVVLVSRGRYRMACTRRLLPSTLPVGARATVVLRLENVGRLPTATLLMEDRLPHALGGRPRFVLDRIEAGGTREVTYGVEPPSRGRHRVGPLTVRLVDPFGLVELVRDFPGTVELLATPVVQALPAVALTGDRSGSGETRARAVGSAGPDDSAVREYRRGDDLRRVHWRSTARTGDLMVRREELPEDWRAVVLLDGRQGAHLGNGPNGTFEWCVSAAASVGMHLSGRGYRLQLLREDGSTTGELAAGAAQGVLLEALALAEPSRAPGLDAAAQTVRTRAPQALLVAVLGLLEPEQASALVRARAGRGAAVALFADTTAWRVAGSGVDRQRRTARHACADILTAAGWRVLTAEAATPLPLVWSRLQPTATAAGR